MSSIAGLSKEREVMNVRLAAAFLALVGASGCIIVDTTKASGDVRFQWTFNGGTCAGTSGIKSIKVTIPGETLSTGGVYNCTTSGSDGITLFSFAGGTYTYTVTARGASDETLYT